MEWVVITEIILPNRQSFKILDEDLEQVSVLKEFKPEINWLLKRNRDLFINEDRRLDWTNTEGIYEPLKKRSYHTPFKQRKMIDSTVDEMMQAGRLNRKVQYPATSSNSLSGK